MSWRDHDNSEDPFGRMGRPGGDWQGLRPTFDNPMSWSVPMARFLGIAVRVHAVFLIYVVVQLARSLNSDSPLGFSLVALQMACLFGIVLIHEFGHSLACRFAGGESNEILMWPLGGLAYCRPPNVWRAHFITAVGGPMVNVIICAVLAPILGILTGAWLGVALPNPLVFDLTHLFVDGRQPWWLIALFTVHFISLMLLLFNLLPIFPLDGGRICQACLWPKVGYSQSMRLAVYVGYLGAIGLFIFGAVVGQWMLIAIAAFGGITCYITLKQLQYTDSIMGMEDDTYAASLWGSDDDAEPDRPRKHSRAEKKAVKQEEAEIAEAREMDRILAKIAAQGMGSLSGQEKRLLKRVTQRKKREGL